MPASVASDARTQATTDTTFVKRKHDLCCGDGNQTSQQVKQTSESNPGHSFCERLTSLIGPARTGSMARDLLQVGSQFGTISAKLPAKLQL